jgi:Fic family protein
MAVQVAPSPAALDGTPAPDARRSSSSEDLARRVMSHFLEMPGLLLTLPQAQRLFGLDPDTCRRTLDALVRTGFLSLTPRGMYGRSDRFV